MLDSIISHISSYAELNNSEINFFKKHTCVKKYKKHELIFTQGKISTTIYFLINGCVRLFYNVDGNDKTAFFYTEGKFICAGESYTFGTPAKENFSGFGRI